METEIKVLDQGYIKVIETWGSDERIIEAARMSTAKGFQGWGGPCIDCGSHGWYVVPDRHTGEAVQEQCERCEGTGQITGDEKLLKFLYQNKHMTPFEMAGMIIEVQAPIFVFREWHRHRTQSYNELSARYTALPDLFYVPSIERIMRGKQATKNKQSSEQGFTYEEAVAIQGELLGSYAEARTSYDRLLGDGLAREIARLVIPVAQYSRMRASANLRNWLAFLTLRMEKGAQWEIREYANELAKLIGVAFPQTYKLFIAGLTP